MYNDFSADELGFMRGLKIAHRVCPAGTVLLHEGAALEHLYTLYTGWAFRYKLLRDGRRQILNILLPGDTIGLDIILSSRPHYAVEAATDLTYCVLDVRQLPQLFEKHAGLARRLAGLAVRERRFLDRRVALAGRCSAEERIAAFLLGLYDRLEPRGMARDNAFTLPLTQQQLADALGLNVIHLNRMLRRLRESGVVTIEEREVRIEDAERLRRIAPLQGGLAGEEPLL
jgi:CRP-like cAMP-binding protein